jgi:hypothetical protein
MAWEIHNGRRVYYRSRRVGRRVGRDYFGAGSEARLAAALGELRRAERRAERAERRANRERWEAARGPLDALIDGTDLLARAALLAAGYRRRHRGIWRKRRDKTLRPSVSPPEAARASREAGDATPTGEPPAQGEASAAGRLAELVRRAQAGGETVLPELREAMGGDPSKWQTYGDLAARAQDAWLSLLIGRDVLARESIRVKLDALRAELGGASPSSLERLLVERIAACWIHVHAADALYAGVARKGAADSALREAAKQQESAQRRYLAALKQLALVRKLIKPSPSPIDLQRPVEEKASPVVRRGTSVPPLRVLTEAN